MGGVIGLTLTACTTDSVFDDVDKRDNGLETSNGNSGDMTTFSDTGDDYQSFWNIYTRGKEMFYRYENLTGDLGNPAILNFRITPYVGLAYCDDDVTDNQFDDVYNFGFTPGPFNSNPAGTYPNIFDPTGNEIGNFMPARPFTLTGTGITPGSVSIEIVSNDHCHVIGANVGISVLNPNGVFFDITSPPLPYQVATPQEEDLLSQYGKVFFYYWEAIDPATLNVVAEGYIMPRCNTANGTYWTNTGINVTLPNGSNADMYRNEFSLDTGFSSFELVLEKDVFPWEETFTATIGGVTYSYKVELQTYLGGTSDPVSILKINDL